MSKLFDEFYESIINEAGQEAGKLELVKIDLKTAIETGTKIFESAGKDLYQEIQNFDKNFLFAQKQAGSGRTLRKDMPVIDGKDVKVFQARLKGGDIDINEPHSPHSGCGGDSHSGGGVRSGYTQGHESPCELLW